MEPLGRLTAIAAPFPEANVDTDQIAPARFLSRRREEGFACCLFHDLRTTARGEERADFVLNDAAYKGAKILVAGVNFGCGSSREQAVYALYDYGFRAVIAPSLGDIFRMNCTQNGLAPIVLPLHAVTDLMASLLGKPGASVTIDIAKACVVAPNGAVHSFEIGTFEQELLLSGREALDVTLEAMPRIESFESRHRIW